MNSLGDGALRDRVSHLVVLRPGGAVGRDGARRVLGAAPPSHTNQPMLRMQTMALTHALRRTPKISLAGSMRMFSKKNRPNVYVREVQGEHLALAETEPALDPEHDTEQRRGSRATRTGRSGGTSCR